MAAVTWRNIAPIDTSGILDSVNTAGRQIGTGIAGIGDALTGYADDRTTSETDILRHALLQAADEKAKEEIMASQDMSFIDKGVLADIEKEKQDAARKQAIWDTQNAIEHAQNVEIANIGKKINVKGYGKQTPGETFVDTYGGIDDSNLMFSHGYDSDDAEELQQKGAYVLNRWGTGTNQDINKTISQKDWNAWASERLSFRDELFDDFEFTHDGKKYDLDDVSDDILYDAILKFKGQASNKEIEESNAFTKWLTTQPENMASDPNASNIFMETPIYNDIQFKYNKNNK